MVFIFIFLSFPLFVWTTPIIFMPLKSSHNGGLHKWFFNLQKIVLQPYKEFSGTQGLNFYCWIQSLEAGANSIGKGQANEIDKANEICLSNEINKNPIQLQANHWKIRFDKKKTSLLIPMWDSAVSSCVYWMLNRSNSDLISTLNSRTSSCPAFHNL